jgi:hypothetical protein
LAAPPLPTTLREEASEDMGDWPLGDG